MSISSGSKILASDVNSHINNKSNPHAVTASQIGAATTAQIIEIKNSIPEEDYIMIDLTGFSFYNVCASEHGYTLASGTYFIFPYSGKLQLYYMYNNNAYFFYDSPSNVKITVPSGMTIGITYGLVFKKS